LRAADIGRARATRPGQFLGKNLADSIDISLQPIIAMVTVPMVTISMLMQARGLEPRFIASSIVSCTCDRHRS
jgi:hypothetical protein